MTLESPHPSLDGVPETKRRKLEAIMVGGELSSRHVLESQIGFVPIDTKREEGKSDDSQEGNSSIKQFLIKQAPGQVENAALKEATAQMQKQLEEKEALIAKLKQNFQDLEAESSTSTTAIREEVRELRAKVDSDKEDNVNRTIDFLRSIADLEVKQNMQKLMSQNISLGRITTRRDGHQIAEVWEDGELFLELRESQEMQQKEKQDIETARKSMRKPSSDLDDDERLEEEEILRLRAALLKSWVSETRLLEHKLNAQKMDHIGFTRRLRFQTQSKYKDHPVLHSRYLLMSLIGKGGFSEVWKGYDLTSGDYVAVKLHEINPRWDEVRKENFVRHAYRENSILQSLDHPRIVKCFDIFLVNNNTLATVLELCQGSDLSEFLQKRPDGIVPEKWAKAIMIQVFSALKYLNTLPQKIIHFDLKPSNLLFHNGSIKVADFGLSKLMEEGAGDDQIELTSPGYGSYWYLPPECFATDSAKISSKVDVWSAGVIFYQMLYGKRPVGHDLLPGKQLIDRILNSESISIEFPAKPVVSVETKDLITRCINPDSKKRPDLSCIFSDPYFKQEAAGFSTPTKAMKKSN